MLSATTTSVDVNRLESLARHGRWLVVSTVAASGAGHIGGPLSAMDVLIALYFEGLNIDPENDKDPERDRFILSKGHCAIGLYSALALRGYFPVDELATFDQGNSRLQGHPDMKLTPGVDVSSGSLGQGLAAGAGIAIGAKKLGKSFRTWVMMGDGELQEGMVWEAVHTARRFGLDNLTAIVDVNGLQQFGWPSTSPDDRFDRSEPWAGVDLGAVFTGFGWNVLTIDGHDFTQILHAFELVESHKGSGKPTVILSQTTKGKGISFTEGTIGWHNGIATPEQLDIAAVELAPIESDDTEQDMAK
jgi:transketolase